MKTKTGQDPREQVHEFPDTRAPSRNSSTALSKTRSNLSGPTSNNVMSFNFQEPERDGRSGVLKGPGEPDILELAEAEITGVRRRTTKEIDFPA